jgi:hypothetical protein
MRYSISAKDRSHNPSEHIVDGTVIFTLITGLIFLYFGMRFKKMWIKFWGILTIIACLIYFTYS